MNCKVEIMGFFDFLRGKQEKKKSNRKGEIGLKEWFNSLSKSEKEKVRKYYSMGFSDPKNLESEIKSSSSNQQKFIGGIGQNALSQKDYSFAETVLLEALQSKDDNPLDRHFVYNSLIDLYYKKRDISSDAIENCIEYCLEDIKFIEDFQKAWEREFGDELPRIPSFERLAIIYEKQGKLEEAIEICQMALKLGLKDSTKGGFEGRVKRLQKKLNKNTPKEK